MSATTENSKGGLNPVSKLGAETVNYYYKDGDVVDIMGGIVKSVGISSGFAMINTHLKNQFQTEGSQFRNICYDVTKAVGKVKGTDYSDGKNQELLDKEAGRTAYVLYNWLEFMPFPLVYQMVDHFTSQWHKRTGKIPYTEQELEEQKKPVLQRWFNQAKRATRVVFRDTFAVFFASLFDINIEYFLDEALKDVPAQVSAASIGIDQIVLPKMNQLHKLLGEDGAEPLAQQTAEAMYNIITAIDPTAATKFNSGNIGDIKTQREMVGVVIETLHDVKGKLSAVFTNMQEEQKAKGEHAAVTEENAATVAECMKKLGAIGTGFRNFNSVEGKFAEKLNSPTAVTGGTGAAEHMHALELRESGREDLAKVHDDYSRIFRDTGNFINTYNKGLGGSEANKLGGELQSKSKFWKGIVGFLESVGISKGLATNWIMAGTCFGPGFNLARFTAYDVFDSYLWKDPNKKDVQDDRSTGEKISDYVRGKFAVVGSVYAGAAPMAAGMSMYQKSIKDGAMADFAQTVGDFTRKTGLNKVGFKDEQTAEWAMYRFMQFAPYLGPREAARNFISETSKPAFDVLGKAIDVINGSGRGRVQQAQPEMSRA